MGLLGYYEGKIHREKIQRCQPLAQTVPKPMPQELGERSKEHAACLFSYKWLVRTGNVYLGEEIFIFSFQT